MNDNSPVSQCLDQMSQLLTQARQDLSVGAMESFNATGEDIQKLCQKVLAAPLEQRSEHAAKLEVIMKRLQDLEAELRVKKDALAEEIQSLGTHKKAHSAYASAPQTHQGE